MLTSLLRDESGFVVSAELVLVSTVLILGLIVGLSEVQHALNAELNDVGDAIGSLNQSYYYSGFSKVDRWNQLHAFTNGSYFQDVVDDCDNNQCDIACDAAVLESPKYGDSCDRSSGRVIRDGHGPVGPPHAIPGNHPPIRGGEGPLPVRGPEGHGEHHHPGPVGPHGPDHVVPGTRPVPHDRELHGPQSHGPQGHGPQGHGPHVPGLMLPHHGPEHNGPIPNPPRIHRPDQGRIIEERLPEPRHERHEGELREEHRRGEHERDDDRREEGRPDDDDDRDDA